MHLSILFSLLTCAAAVPTKRQHPAPLRPISDNATAIPGQYIIVFKDEVTSSGFSDVMELYSDDFNYMYVYEDIFKGFTTSLNEHNLKVWQDHPDVEYIEPDQIAYGSTITQQATAPWGLSRISHRRPGSLEYVYDSSGGEGVCAYVIDSGVDDTHFEFEGRASQVATFVWGSKVDDNGHGTHVAGTIGGRTYGVAKGVKIFGVKVLGSDNEGDFSAIIAGMDYVHRDVKKRYCPNGVVVNLSLTGPLSYAANQAAARLAHAGFFVAVAAGNYNSDARQYSPAAEASICTVGATAKFDTRYEMSNWGPAVDILAPGVEIISTLPGNRYGFLSGTSMAAPHITGLAAYLAASRGQRAGPWLCQLMQQISTPGVITDQVPNTVNLVAFNGAT
ncbi:hypothetical protein QQS21_004174 [Conoideocrella luteorostrata]|uniref:Uncharacterized protein n=1 Tax=Conoideocrella luteorostrata TaxID=1105319 RepID=A0AAJ0CRY1_9HYPO|nr:hypothetical protein QQS21_004174 [Conoideocrella luteorostrata]